MANAAFLCGVINASASFDALLGPPVKVLLRTDASLDRDASPLLEVATDAFGKRFGRAGFRHHALRNERLGPLGGLEDVIHLAIEPRDHRRRGGGGHDERNPQGGFVTARPASATVGNSGSAATRVLPLVASARNCPARILGSDGAMVANCMSSRPVIMSVMDCDELL